METFGLYIILAKIDKTINNWFKQQTENKIGLYGAHNLELYKEIKLWESTQYGLWFSAALSSRT